jgi:hypothetical protein
MIWPTALNERSMLADIAQVTQQDYVIEVFLVCLSFLTYKTGDLSIIISRQYISYVLLPHVNNETTVT